MPIVANHAHEKLKNGQIDNVYPWGGGFPPPSGSGNYSGEGDGWSGMIDGYIDGAKSGRGADMKPAFHPDATIFGYVGDDLFAGPIQQLFDWNDEKGLTYTTRPLTLDLTEELTSV